jgi:hypothetical protein
MKILNSQVKNIELSMIRWNTMSFYILQFLMSQMSSMCFQMSFLSLKIYRFPGSSSTQAQREVEKFLFHEWKLIMFVMELNDDSLDLQISWDDICKKVENKVDNKNIRKTSLNAFHVFSYSSLSLFFLLLCSSPFLEVHYWWFLWNFCLEIPIIWRHSFCCINWNFIAYSLCFLNSLLNRWMILWVERGSF